MLSQEQELGTPQNRINPKTRELIGTLAGVLTTGTFIPQAYRVWSHTPQLADSVSLPTYLIVSIGVVGWLTQLFFLKT